MDLPICHQEARSNSVSLLARLQWYECKPKPSSMQRSRKLKSNGVLRGQLPRPNRVSTRHSARR